MGDLTPKTIGHHRILGRLGAGGMGEVFLAEDTRLGRKVAVKMLPERTTADPQARQRLLREARAAAALDHPHICSIFEVGEDAGQIYIVMQYVDGQTLAGLTRHRPLPAGEWHRVASQGAEALAEAHARGIIHRDIKPQNLMVTPRGQLKVLDFGLARFAPQHAAAEEAETMTATTQDGVIVGTPGYMAPEQLMGKAADERSDIFSLGVTLYEAATARPAFGRGAAIEVGLRVITQALPPPSTLNPELTEDVDRILARAMQKDPTQRYPSAEALLADLKALRGFANGPDTPNVEEIKPTSDLSGIKVLGGGTPEARVWYERGTAAIREASYFQATKALERAIQLDKGFALAHARLGEACAEIELLDRAKDELLEAMALVTDRSLLPAADAMALDAVAATVRRNFEAAIHSYRSLVDSSSMTEKAAAYVDLGRAYEKAEDFDQAIQCYMTAAELQPESAAAFSRLGVIFALRYEFEKALEAFARAESIYDAMSNLEGVARIFHDRGYLFMNMQRLPEARPQFERSIEIASSASNQFQTIRSQLALCRVLFAQGDTVRAKALSSEALDAAQTANMRGLATQGLIDIGYTLLARGEVSAAETSFQRALDLAQRDKTPRAEAFARLALGSLLIERNDLDDAVRHLDAARSYLAPLGYRGSAGKALLLLGRAYRDQGRYDTAFEAFDELERNPSLSSTTQQRAATKLSLGVLLGIHQENYAEALTHLDESYRAYVNHGSKQGIGFAQQNRGWVLFTLGRYGEASQALAEAEAIAKAPGAEYRPLSAWLALTRSAMALSQRLHAEARQWAREALNLTGADYVEVALQARQFMALADAREGGSTESTSIAEEEVTVARNLGIPRLVSAALVVAAEAHLRCSNLPRAIEAAGEAQALCAAAGQIESEWRALLIAAQAMNLAGDRPGAYDCAARADSSRDALSRRVGPEHYRSYAERPDIEVSLSELQALLPGSSE